MQPISDANSAFLRSAADDLQRQLGATSTVEALTMEEVPDGVALVAALRIGQRSTAIRGRGANLVAAYSDQRLAISQPVLAAAFADLVEP